MFTEHDESWKNTRTSECGFRLIKHKSGTLFSSSLGLGVSLWTFFPSPKMRESFIDPRQYPAKRTFPETFSP
jgi:hypothetical protein